MLRPNQLISNILTTCLIIAFFSCEQKKKSPEALYTSYCGTCHLAPSPADLSRNLWEHKVLPEMGARLGVNTPGYDPYQGKQIEERMTLESYGVYPETPLIAAEDWESIKEYVLALAPERLPIDSSRAERNKSLAQFAADTVSLDSKGGSLVTSLNFDAAYRRLHVTDANGMIWNWQHGGITTSEVQSGASIVDFERVHRAALVTDIGQMHPTDMSLGSLWRRDSSSLQLIAGQLRRPVFTKAADLNGDGTDEILVCEYGNYIGQLSLIDYRDGHYLKSTLIDQPGAIEVEVADLNNDGLQDIAALFAQGNEGVYFLLQDSDLSFKMKQVIRLNPLYGTSAFELFDYEGDGDLDIAVVCGDNADYTPVFKPYHGLRLFTNEGNFQFKEVFFYPIYGATQVVADDFDKDGDIDFAVSSFFPDFSNSPEESFVYLENISPSTYTFQPSTTALAVNGRWIVMEKGDVDQDGDTDLVLGSFTYSPAKTPYSNILNWSETTTDLLLLLNNLL